MAWLREKEDAYERDARDPARAPWMGTRVPAR